MKQQKEHTKTELSKKFHVHKSTGSGRSGFCGRASNKKREQRERQGREGRAGAGAGSSKEYSSRLAVAVDQ